MMMAASSTPVINGNNDVEKEPSAENGPSRFTAVNGKESLTSGASGSPSVNNEQQREASESWRGSGYSTPFQQEPSLHGYDDIGNDQEDARSQQSPCHCDPPSVIRTKRKRSRPEEHQRTCQSSYRVSGASKALVSTIDGRIDLGVPPSNASVTPASDSDRPAKEASLSTQPPRSEDPQALSVDSRCQDYKPRLVSTSQHAQQIDPSDAHLAEALQYEAGTCQKNPDLVKRPMEGLVPPDQPIYPQERPQATVQVAPKRKRVFSNRTKTGCMTCRRRKKKCDEQHPTCNNCIRGGFLCEGYSSRGAFQKPSNPKTAVPLQSKEGYAEVSSQYIHDIGPQHGGQRSLIEHPDPGKMKSIVADESDRVISQYNASPIDTSSNPGSWIKRSLTGPGHPAYISEHVAKSEIREVPLVHEISRGGRPKIDYQAVVPLRESPYVSKPAVPLLQTGIEQRPVHTTSLGSNSPQTQARIALSIEQQLSEETEKDKMLRGDLYQPFDIHLVEERNRCKAALWRFNNACNAIFGSSVKEQSRLLKDVLVPPASSPSGALPPKPGGSIGQGAVVVAPFECHYGYNIHIGEDVMISEACRFIDDCHINIGAHTWIGPGVTILSSMAHPSMQERKGSQSRYQGRPVTIEEDCYVGANCTIYPGVRIRRGAYVAPGEVVKSDIVAYGFQGFKPSYM